MELALVISDSDKLVRFIYRVCALVFTINFNAGN